MLIAGLVGALASVGVSAAAGGTFADVGANHPFKEDIDFMAETGIAGGYGDGTYRPGAPVSRQAMAAFIHRSNTFVVEESARSVTHRAADTATAACSEPGHRVISGGATTSNVRGIAITASGPTYDQAGWTVFTSTTDGSYQDFEIRVWAICGPVEVSRNGS